MLRSVVVVIIVKVDEVLWCSLRFSFEAAPMESIDVFGERYM